MKKILSILLAIFLLIGILIVIRPPAQTPQLSVRLRTESAPTQHLQTAQLSNNWDIGTRAYCISSFHPLDFWTESWVYIDFDAFVLQLDGADGEIDLQFSNNFLPHTVYVRRWNAKFVGQAFDMQFEYEPIEISNHIIRVSDDGNDYIYEVEAIWAHGRSSYTFRIDSA